MSRNWTLLPLILFLGSTGTLQAQPLDSPDVVYIDGQPCSRACQAYMNWTNRALAARRHEEREISVAAPPEAEFERVEPVARPRAAKHGTRSLPRIELPEAEFPLLPGPRLRYRAEMELTLGSLVNEALSGGGGFRRQPQGAAVRRWNRPGATARIGEPDACGSSLDAGIASLRAIRSQSCRHCMYVGDRCVRFLTTTRAGGTPSGMQRARRSPATPGT